MLTSSTIAAAFEKIAKPRWVRELAGKGLSSAAMGRIQKLGLPEREVKPLGMGGEQVADLVFHPKHGLSVRKIPRTVSALPQELTARTKDAERRHAFWREAGEHPGFARFFGSEGPVSHHEYVPPGHKEVGPRLDNLLRKMHKRSKVLERRLKRPDGGDEVMLRDALSTLNKRRTAIYDRAMGAASLSPEGASSLKKLRKKYPNLYDVRPANVHQKKILDASLGGNIPTFHLDASLGASKLPLPSRSKRIWLGSRKAAPSGTEQAMPAAPSPAANKAGRSNWLTPGRAAAIGGGGAAALAGGALLHHLLKRKKDKKRA